MIKKNAFLFIMITFVGCANSKKVNASSKNTTSLNKNISTSSKPKNNTITNDLIQSYIANFKDYAINNMINYGIPASITLAQAILESGAGQGALAIKSNNHFGIKCNSDWKGNYVNHDDDAAQECFRQYEAPEESFKDHSLFLNNKKRYANLFFLPKDDYVSWAKGLKAAGYATDPQYADKLITYIERFNLQQYDKEALMLVKDKDNQVKPQKEKFKKENIEVKTAADGNKKTDETTFYEVQKGDTMYSISKKFNLLVDELQKKNNITDFKIEVGQKLIIK